MYQRIRDSREDSDMTQREVASYSVLNLE